MDFIAVLREQVDIFSCGSEVDRTVCSSGAAIVSASEPVYYLNSFYPLEHGFRFSRECIRDLDAFYASRRRDGCVLDCSGQFTDRAVAKVAAIHVPCSGLVGSARPVGDEFSCVRTFDIDEWCSAYVEGSPDLDRGALWRRMTDLMRCRDTRLYVFRDREETIGAGALVRAVGDVYLASGFSIKKHHRGAILSRARWVRMSTESDVVAVTGLKFARVLVRAIDGASILGTGEFVRISSM